MHYAVGQSMVCPGSPGSISPDIGFGQRTSKCPSGLLVLQRYENISDWLSLDVLLVFFPYVWPVVLGNRVNFLEYTFLMCYLLVFMTEFDDLINVLGSTGNSLHRRILRSNRTLNE